MFTGTDATLVVDANGWEVFAEPRKRGIAAAMKREARLTEKIRAAHARNLLDAVKSRRAPVENLEIGHHVSTVAHLGNLALRSRSRIEWNAEAQRVENNPEANGLLSRRYREPWRFT